MLFLAALHGLSLLSGAASLVDEVCWARMLVLVLGNTVSSSAMIAAVFMAGLGVGSWACARGLRRPREGLRLYAALELCIGVFAASSPAAFHLLRDLFARLAPDSPSLILDGARLAAVCLFLFLPAFLMGAAYPALASALGPGRAGGRGAASLYALNTLGASGGALLGGLWLLPSMGICAALGSAAGMHLLAACAAALLDRRTRDSSVGRPADGLPDPAGARAGPADSRVSGIVFASVFAVGWAALSHQALMTRLAILFFGNGIAVFPVVLAAFLLGTGVSAWLASGRALLSQDRLAGAFCLLLAAGGLSLALSPLILGGYAAADLGWMGKAQDLVLLAAVFPPICLLGALLPAAIRLLSAREKGFRAAPAAGDAAGTARGENDFRAAGRIYALDSLGGLLGAATANTLFVPRLGVQGTLSAQ
ncbi:MAG: fused MFS/spermidine synthase, partial [Elusimicrobiota bacterium]